VVLRRVMYAGHGMIPTGEPQARIQSDIEALCRFQRGSASEGEREAAHWVASRFEETGLKPEREDFSFYPEYWNVWGAHMLGAIGAWLLLGRGGRRRRLAGAAATSFLTASFWGDASARFYWLRRLFPARPSINVLARLPNPRAKRVLVIAAHIDAAHSGLVFHPGLLRWLRSRNPEGQISPALVLPFRGLVFLTAASVLRAIGLPRGIAKVVATPGVLISAATAAVMADIGRRPVVAGANDDASGVATVLALAQDLVTEPPENIEVWFLATGSEEAIEGGIHAFLKRHRADLEGHRPFFLNLEMLGSGQPVYQRAEGHVTSFQMHAEAITVVEAVAHEPEFAAVEGIVSPAQSDALAAHHYGFPAVTVMSLPTDDIPHYHWASDTPENIDGASLDRCYRFLRRIIQRLDQAA
jgi:hypothetical protein